MTKGDGGLGGSGSYQPKITTKKTNQVDLGKGSGGGQEIALVEGERRGTGVTEKRGKPATRGRRREDVDKAQP